LELYVAKRPDPVVERFEAAQDRLVLQAADFSLATIADMVSRSVIDIEPEFQRRERWAPSRRSALIESFLLNIPIPPIYLAEDDFGRYSVIDGKQRLSAITDFMEGGFALTSLTRFTELEGYDFDDLPPPLQNFLSVRPSIRAVSLLRQSDPQLKYEVFHRLNSGGEPLNAQEIRNVVFRGPLNDFLVQDLSTEPFLRQQLKITSDHSPAFRKMQDVEYVLRFLTLAEVWETFSGDLRWSMDLFMAEHQYATSPEIHEFGRAFRQALETCESLWGPAAFKRPDASAWRDQALAGMYDAQMVAVHELRLMPSANLRALSGAAIEATRDLFGDPEFESAVRTATNTPSKLHLRVIAMVDLLRSIV
jgi:hypothetical protein